MKKSHIRIEVKSTEDKQKVAQKLEELGEKVRWYNPNMNPRKQEECFVYSRHGWFISYNFIPKPKKKISLEQLEEILKNNEI